ncbi:MAG: glycosyltransferase family 4 protein [candidate division Zixibacteria bacterium]|nr:glycosyltransferase family 4 protein [candidate division Zixibacteria bacterium]
MVAFITPGVHPQLSVHKMHPIYIATTTDLAAFSGQALRMKQLIAHMAQQRPVALLASSPINLPLTKIDQFPCNRLAIRRFDARSFGLGGILQTLRLAGALRDFLAQARMVYTDMPLVLLYTAVGKRRIAGVIEVNGIYSEEWIEKGYVKNRSDLRYHLMRLLEGRALRSARAVIAVSPGLREYLVHEFRVNPERIHVIPNGIDTALLEAGSAEAAPALPDGPVALFVGSFRPWHGVQNLLYALPHMLARVPSLKLVLVGDGPLRAECETLADRLGIRHATVFTGQQPPKIVAGYMAVAQVCLYYPNYNVKRYGFMGDPIKLREYMAMGKPIVTVRIPNFAEIVEETGCGLVVEADPERYAAAVSDLIERPEQAVLMGRRGRQAIEREYDWAVISERILTVIDQTVEAEPSLARQT